MAFRASAKYAWKLSLRQSGDNSRCRDQRDDDQKFVGALGSPRAAQAVKIVMLDM